ncbi:hypothetical protein [Jannaschia pohangensis]|nr:hypothetical protein [Jannaschia pohangensis]
MLGGLLAVGLMLAGTFHQDGISYEPIPGSSIDNIEFLSATGDNVRDALTRVCSATGCDAGTLHPMITSSAAAMTPDELDLALDAQARILVESQAALSATTDEDARRILSLEVEVASRIADLYRAERANR